MPYQDHFTTSSETWERDGYLRPPAGSSYNKAELNRLGGTLRQMRAPYRLYFTDICLFYDEPNGSKVLTGAATEYVPTWHDKQTDVYLLGLATQSDVVSRPYFKESEAYKREQNEVERALFGLFRFSPHWEAIALDGVKLVIQGEERCLSRDFSQIFFKRLHEKVRGLKSLSVKGVLLPASSQHFLQILQHNRNLTALGCQFRADQMLYFRELLEGIAEHPCLQALDLGQTVLDRQGYQALSSLLDKNYRLEKIGLLPPSNQVLAIEHKALMERLGQLPAERFKKEQLHQRNLLALIEKNLQLKSYVAPLLKRPAHLPAITWHMAEQQAILETWPAIYQTHRRYLDVNWSYAQLDIHTRLETDKSVTLGAYLLAEAAKLGSKEVICYLLEIGADPLEKLGGDLVKQIKGESLLTRALFDKKQARWSQAVIAYVKKGFVVLAPRLSRLIPYFSVYGRIDEMGRHLTGYLDQLDKRNKLPRMVRWITRLSSRLNERKAELENAFKKMVDLINAGTEYGEVSDVEFNSMFWIVSEIEKDAQKARRGLKGRSEFNDKLGELCIELEKEILEWKDKLKTKEVEKRVRQEHSGQVNHLEKENEGLHEALQAKNKEVVKLEAQIRAQDKKIQEQDTKLQEQDTKLQEQDTKLQEQDTKLQGQDTKLQTQEEKIKELAEEARIENERFKQEIAQLFRLVSGRRPSQEGAAGEERPRFFKP